MQIYKLFFAISKYLYIFRGQNAYNSLVILLSFIYTLFIIYQNSKVIIPK